MKKFTWRRKKNIKRIWKKKYRNMSEKNKQRLKEYQKKLSQGKKVSI